MTLGLPSSLRENPLLRIGLLLALVGLVVLLGSARVLRQTDENLRANRAIVEQREVLARSFEQLLTDLDATAEAREVLRSVRPPPDNLVRLVRGLEAIAARVFIDQQIAAIPPEGDSGGQPYAAPVVRYRITLLGTGEKVEGYLRELPRLPELVRVERLELATTPDSDVFVNSTAELLFAVAVRRLP